ncbi:DUF2842 domain-containing protein [Paracoccaceae bacterium]|jgi:hypothetical protein|nr:hypothetical protein [Marinovum sp.]MDB3930651.1 DUF2842 domain-containing protein [Paracoccaceae bacterium]MDC0900253.1 DUF2842 domain-containing protein [Paracoccaceae bacterium]|tara:strand:+ start:816 stop:1037 length:222 start_codon:yes stop_codon:yes gene_type:complete
MNINYKNRRRISLFLLLVGLPVYVIVAINILAFFERPSILLEVIIYLSLGIIWALPFKFIFKGIGQADPEQTE